MPQKWIAETPKIKHTKFPSLSLALDGSQTSNRDGPPKGNQLECFCHM